MLDRSATRERYGLSTARIVATVLDRL